MKEIPLKRGGVALVDDEDYEYLSQWSWTTDDDGYPSRYYRNRPQKIFGCIKMHRAIMNPAAGEFVDHIDHNLVNNQRSNLRIANFQTNGRNRLKQKKPAHSIYKGVTKSFKKNGLGFRWQATIGIGQSKTKTLGYFNTEIEAALAYDFSAAHLYGEFACLNKYPEGLAV